MTLCACGANLVRLSLPRRDISAVLASKMTTQRLYFLCFVHFSISIINEILIMFLCDMLKSGACGDFQDNCPKRKDCAVLQSVFHSDKLKKSEKKNLQTLFCQNPLEAKKRIVFNGFHSADFKLSKSKNLIEH